MKFMPFCSDVISSSMFSNIKQQLFFVDLTTKIVVFHKFFGLFQLRNLVWQGLKHPYIKFSYRRNVPPFYILCTWFIFAKHVQCYINCFKKISFLLQSKLITHGSWETSIPHENVPKLLWSSWSWVSSREFPRTC